jgi:hypothetical protein
MHVDLSFSYLRSAATASFDKKEFHRNRTVPFFTQGREGGLGRVEPERRLEGQQFTKLGPKIPHD